MLGSQGCKGGPSPRVLDSARPCLTCRSPVITMLRPEFILCTHIVLWANSIRKQSQMASKMPSQHLCESSIWLYPYLEYPYSIAQSASNTKPGSPPLGPSDSHIWIKAVLVVQPPLSLHRAAPSFKPFCPPELTLAKISWMIPVDWGYHYCLWLCLEDTYNK